LIRAVAHPDRRNSDRMRTGATADLMWVSIVPPLRR
jgi:hypothetical protein